MEGVSGRITDCFKRTEAPLRIHSMPLAEPPKKVKHGPGRPQKAQPIVIAIHSDSTSSDQEIEY